MNRSDVYGVPDDGNPDSSVVLVNINDSSSTDIITSHTTARVAINVGTLEAFDQVTVTRAYGDGVGYASSELLAKLNAGDRGGSLLMARQRPLAYSASM